MCWDWYIGTMVQRHSIKSCNGANASPKLADDDSGVAPLIPLRLFSSSAPPFSSLHFLPSPPSQTHGGSPSLSSIYISPHLSFHFFLSNFLVCPSAGVAGEGDRRCCYFVYYFQSHGTSPFPLFPIG